MKPSILLLSVFSFHLSLSAFAICEQERAEFQEWSSRTEQLTAAAELATLIGVPLAIPSFGASMIPVAAAGFSAENAKRIRDEKRNNLTRCEESETARAAQAQAAAKRAEAEAELELLNARMKSDYQAAAAQNIAIFSEQATEMCVKEIQDFISELISSGHDISDPATEELINDRRAVLEAKRDEMIADFVAKINSGLSEPIRHIIH